MIPNIVFEDDSLLVLEKPAGLVVNRTPSAKAETLEDWLKKRKGGKGEVKLLNRAGIVHRLDKETSGLLVVAKTPEALENLQAQFKTRKVEKKYLALVHGRVLPREGEISGAISRSHFNRKKFGVFMSGKPAKTKYKVKQDYGDYTLLELKPITGRTHQIRVHLKHLGHPVVGDEKYGGRKKVRADRQWCPRQFLHATLLSFFHPVTKKKVSFSSPLPQDLKQALEVIR